MTVRELLESVLREADHEDDILVTFNNEVIEPSIKSLPPTYPNRVGRRHINIELPEFARLLEY